MENQNQRNNEETEIDLVELFWVLWRKLPLMIAVGLFTALLAFGGSKFLMTPTYQSVTKIYVLNKQDNSNTNVTYSDLQAGTQLVKDYSELIKSRFVLEAVIEQLGLPLSYEKLSRKVTVSTPADTRVISIAVTNSNPVMAMKIANAIRETASTHICNVMDIEAVNIVETANVPTHKASPSVGKNTMLGGMLGILMVAAIVILSHLMNDTIQTEEDVEKYLGISTLAMIPLNEAESRKKTFSIWRSNPSAPSALMRLSGSCSGGRMMKPAFCTSVMTGRAASSARRAALRPAASPSNEK